MELIEHLQEEEHQHEIALRALTDTLKTRGVVDVDLGQALDAEVFRLHLMQDHFETARALNSKEMSADLAAKVREHISEEEERHLLALRSLKSRLAAVNPANVSVDVYDPTVKVEQRIPHQPRPKVGDSALESAWKGTGAAPTSAPEEAPQATVGDLPETPPQTLPAEPSRLDRALGSLMGEPQSTGRIRLPLPPATWQPGATVGSLKDPRL
ncbi:MAG: hypothetical protein FJX76_08865 [Armatimonadetes bacterium]|nr:hypothetical protein [Armatimonadota bacterium]